MLKSKPVTLGGGVVLGAIGIILFLNVNPCGSLGFILFNINKSLIPCPVQNQSIPAIVKQSVASLMLIPATSSVKVGSSFSVLLEVNSSGTAVNVVSALVSYPANLVKLTKKDESVSLFAIRLGDPNMLNQVMQGQPTPGIARLAPVVRFTFTALAPGQAIITLASSAQVLANDGLGTSVLGPINPASVTISP